MVKCATPDAEGAVSSACAFVRVGRRAAARPRSTGAGASASALEIVDGIGSTEMLHIYCSNRPGEVEPGTSGFAVPGYELLLLDETGAVVEGPGEVGDLRGPGRLAALAFYWHQHEKTKSAMRGDWFCDRRPLRAHARTAHYVYVGPRSTTCSRSAGCGCRRWTSRTSCSSTRACSASASSASRSTTRAGSRRTSSATAAPPAGRRARRGAADVVQGPPAPLRVPPRHRVRRRAAPDADRQGPALPPARDGGRARDIAPPRGRVRCPAYAQASAGTVLREWGRLGWIGVRRPAGAHRAAPRPVRRPPRLDDATREFEDARRRVQPAARPGLDADGDLLRLARARAAGRGRRRARRSSCPGLLVMLALAALFLADRRPTAIAGAAAGRGRGGRRRRGPAPGRPRAGEPRARARRPARPRALGRLPRARRRSRPRRSGRGSCSCWSRCGAVEVGLARGARGRAAAAVARLAAARRRPRRPAGGLAALAWVAFKVGALSYGGGFVIIPLMQGDAVDRYGWMTDTQFAGAVALGQVTPGPVVHTVTAVGYAAAGAGGALLAAVVAFAPSFAFVLARRAPVRRAARRRRASARSSTAPARPRSGRSSARPSCSPPALAGAVAGGGARGRRGAAARRAARGRADAAARRRGGGASSRSPEARCRNEPPRPPRPRRPAQRGRSSGCSSPGRCSR